MKKILKAASIVYDEKKDDAPKVTASGRGKIAEKIIETAEKSGVPIKEDSGLAEILSALDPGESIPPETFRAVAEILAFIYRLDRRIESNRL